MGQPNEHRILEATCEVMELAVRAALGPGGNLPLKSTDYFMVFQIWEEEVQARTRLNQEYRDGLVKGVRANLFKLGFGW